jgi:hypothetical protein
MPKFGMRWRIFDDESHHPIDLGERFLRRRVSGYLDPILAGRFIPAFFEKICIDHYRRPLVTLWPECIWSCRGGSTSGASTFFRLMVAAKNPQWQGPAYVCRIGGKIADLMIKLVAFCVFHFLRLSERVLPLSVLSFLLWPLAAVWDLLHLRQRTPLTCWRRFPESWRPKRWRFVLRQSLGLYHSQFLYIWPDRLRAARWLSRCRLEGGSNYIGPCEGKRAVVGVSLHFGRLRYYPIGCGRMGLS